MKFVAPSLPLVLVLAFLTLSGCATTSIEKQIDAEVAQANGIKSRKDLGEKSDRVIESANSLNATQRAQLATLRDSTRIQLDIFQDQSLRLRAVLIDELVAKNYDGERVELIKERMKNLEVRRLGTLFSAIDQANAIMGREASENRDEFDGFPIAHPSLD